MKKKVKLLINLLLLICLIFTQVSAMSVEEIKEKKSPKSFTHVKLSDPVNFKYDGETSVLLGYFDSEPEYIKDKKSNFSTQADYYEYDRWYVYDNGITQTWSYLSLPYFVRSIARGETYTKEVEVTATISASFGADIPSEAMPQVKSTFGLTASGTKTVKEIITLSGPAEGYSSRSFYYKKGRHKHDVTIIKERRSNWDGVLYTVPYENRVVEEPAIYSYSEDYR